MEIAEKEKQKRFFIYWQI